LSGDVHRLVLEALRSAGRAAPSGWFRVHCPVCEIATGKPDKRRSLGIKPPFYRCWKCDAKGRLPDDMLDGLDTAPVPEKDGPPPNLGPPEGFVSLADPEGREALSLAPARDYLLGRNVGPDMWSAASIGACAFGRHYGRVIVPVLDMQGGWVGWVGRAWEKRAEQPYLYPPGMNRGEVLYHHGALLLETDEPVIVVEGVMDAIALWPRAVALLGKASEWQVQELLAAPRPVCVILDGDAWAEGWALAMRLRLEGQRAGSVRLGPRVDPDEVPRAWLEEQALASLENANVTPIG
jgi:hypothetical protein